MKVFMDKYLRPLRANVWRKNGDARGNAGAAHGGLQACFGLRRVGRF